MVKIVVNGVSERRLAPDRGTVHLVATLEGDDRAAVAVAVADLHERLVQDALAHQRSGAATRWSADQVRVSAIERFDAGHEGPRTRQVAAATLDVRFARFDALSAWVSELAEVTGVEVSGIEWSVSDARRSEALREVRTEAVRDAQRRAADYARALGREDVELLALYESGLRQSDGTAPPVAARAMSFQAAGEPRGFELVPAQIEISARVSADFEAE